MLTHFGSPTPRSAAPSASLTAAPPAEPGHVLDAEDVNQGAFR